MIGRDHHDVSGTDAPFRETSNIKDGSNVTCDMAVQCYAGNAARGMSLVALHNGGGTGIGKAINGGFGLVLDGSHRIDEIINLPLPGTLWVGLLVGTGHGITMPLKQRSSTTVSMQEQTTSPFRIWQMKIWSKKPFKNCFTSKNKKLRKGRKIQRLLLPTFSYKKR